MPIRGYALTAEFADRVEDVVAQVESEYRNPAPKRVRVPVHLRRNVQFIRVPDSDGVTVTGFKYLFARTQTWSVDDGGFSDLFDYDDVALFHIANADLTTDGTAIYEAVQMSDYDFGSGFVPVFATQWQPLVIDVICNEDDNIEITTTS